MSLEIEAVYEDGVLKPEKPLPLKEHERVTVSVKPASEKPASEKPPSEKPPSVKPQASPIRQSAGLLRWTGDPKSCERLPKIVSSGFRWFKSNLVLLLFPSAPTTETKRCNRPAPMGLGCSLPDRRGK